MEPVLLDPSGWSAAGRPFSTKAPPLLVDGHLVASTMHRSCEFEGRGQRRAPAANYGYFDLVGCHVLDRPFDSTRSIRRAASRVSTRVVEILSSHTRELEDEVAPEHARWRLEPGLHIAAKCPLRDRGGRLRTHGGRLRSAES